MRRRRREPIGVLLAGGAGRRIGGDKALVELDGRPLAHHALQALTATLDEVVVACRVDTELPPLPGVKEAWVEAEGTRGPVAGIVSALREARGRPILAVALSLPLVTPDHLRALLAVDLDGRPAVVAARGGRPQPLLARWEPQALPALSRMAPDLPLEHATMTLAPALAAFAADDPALEPVRAPEDLLRAAAALDSRRRAAAHAH